MLVAGLAAIFVSVALGSGAAAWALLQERAPARRRLHAMLTASAGGAVAAPARSGLPVLTSAPHPLVVRLAAMLPRSATRVAEIRQRLSLAGYRSNSAPVVFTAAQVACAIVVFALLLLSGGREWLSYASLGAIVGAMLPDLLLNNRRQLRQQAIANAMPDALDLLVICLEAGCSLDQAMIKAAEELRISRPEIADELGLVMHEIRAGRPRAEAFRQFGVRTGVEEVRSLVSILVQTDRYGTSMTQALRMHGELCRTRRRQRAEERAGKASVKMVFPLVLCLFPAFFLIALGPIFVGFIRSLTSVGR